MVENKIKLGKSYDDKVLFKDLVLQFTRRKKWGKIDFAMLLRMDNVIEVGWEDFVMYESKLFVMICESLDDSYFKFVVEKYGEDWFNTEFLRDTGNNIAVRIACKNGRIERLRYMKERFGLTKEDVQAEENYALRMSCENGHISIVKYLIEEFGLTKEEDVQPFSSTGGFLVYGDISIVKYL